MIRNGLGKQPNGLWGVTRFCPDLQNSVNKFWVKFDGTDPTNKNTVQNDFPALAEISL